MSTLTTNYLDIMGESCEVRQESIAFPGFTAQGFGEYLERSGVEGQTASAKAFRRMLRARLSS
jgi:hypothetical protein